MPTIACVQWGNYCDRGAEYVNTLFDSVRRNLPADYAFRFVCFTDNEAGLANEIEALPLPAGAIGWWNKLHVFKTGLFPAGEQIFLLDLDTLIIGPLDALIEYRGPFAALRDFYHPNESASGVLSWKAGACDGLYEDWIAAGSPAPVAQTAPFGDAAWIQAWVLKHTGEIDFLPDLFPGLFASYKVHCNPFPPQDAAVICFHGNPRPHECTQKWVADVWKAGGSCRLNLTTVPNTNDKTIMEQVMANRDAAPWIFQSEPHGQVAILCGSGPSLLADMDKIREYRNGGGKIFALNNAAYVLDMASIRADFQVILDARKDNADFVRVQYADSYLVASQCHPEVFKTLEGRKVALWHPALDGIGDLFPECEDMMVVGGGTTVGLSAIALAYGMGFRYFALFGYDSSFRGDKMHAAPQSRTAQEAWAFDVTVGNRTFKTNAAMAKQAELFPQFVVQLIDLGCELKVYGDGLLPAVVEEMMAASQPLEEIEHGTTCV